MNDFKVILINPEKQKIILDYRLVGNCKVADIWFNHFMKHLKNLKPDPLESRHENFTVKDVYKDFCKLAEIKPIDLEPIDQKKLNYLHNQFLDNYLKLANKQETYNVASAFHNAIHRAESHIRGVDILDLKPLRIGYGLQEEPLAESVEKFILNRYNDKIIEKNCIYLMPYESGKSPYYFFDDNEPPTDENISKIMVASVTFRGDWFIAIKQQAIPKYNEDFINFFDKVKERFYKKYKKYGLDTWPEHYEHGAVRLADPLHSYDTLQLYQTGYRYHSIVID